MSYTETTAGVFAGKRRLVRSPGRRLSAILRSIAEDHRRERVSVRDLFARMGERAFGALMLIFALPNLVPTPPGTSVILGAPLIFLAAQLMLGRSPWLPEMIAARSMTRSDFAAIVTRLWPYLRRAERLLRPRLSPLCSLPAQYLVGFVSFVLSVILFLPIPLGNILPALAICLFALGFLGRDGLFVFFGLVVSAVSLSVLASVYLMVATVVLQITTYALG
ncbi:exopolysaccharide biosynthesis protein [Rhizobiaceae bacterium n13]|uniref:Exopolysaccharide biosynthesis protein n=1 Tax=Ferirhizobium litorale TaxID=2927786 RepID=A0AAE3TZR9_9HYPH|nr:exopolysaccharide biosynthesis protein [Fererhizobium litorale]MDI7860381.1 exopolysaccharide biosynthesis protein [Fererhizobium litorale]MDI7920516.1 exopolysaccharide biosynthesis protein [Fererhizobium litorale]